MSERLTEIADELDQQGFSVLSKSEAAHLADNANLTQAAVDRLAAKLLDYMPSTQGIWGVQIIAFTNSIDRQGRRNAAEFLVARESVLILAECKKALPQEIEPF